MLSRELMGLLALGVLWVNAGLIVAVAVKQLRRIASMSSQLKAARREGHLVSGEVATAAASKTRFAARHIHQMGRAITTRGPDRILFTDGPQSFEVFGGELSTDAGPVKVAPADGAAVEVWPSPERASQAMACTSSAEFEGAFEDARKSKGHRREVDVDVRLGDRVFVWGERDGDRLLAPSTRPLVVSMVDPVAWAASRMRLLVAFIVVSCGGLALITGLALYPPHFGVVSTIGGALGLAYFLGVQPLGVAVQEAVKTPARKTIGALWHREKAALLTSPV